MSLFAVRANGNKRRPVLLGPHVEFNQESGLIFTLLSPDSQTRWLWQISVKIYTGPANLNKPLAHLAEKTLELTLSISPTKASPLQPNVCASKWLWLRHLDYALSEIHGLLAGSAGVSGLWKLAIWWWLGLFTTAAATMSYVVYITTPLNLTDIDHWGSPQTC